MSKKNKVPLRKCLSGGIEAKEKLHQLFVEKQVVPEETWFESSHSHEEFPVMHLRVSTPLTATQSSLPVERAPVSLVTELGPQSKIPVLIRTTYGSRVSCTQFQTGNVKDKSGFKVKEMPHRLFVEEVMTAQKTVASGIVFKSSHSHQEFPVMLRSMNGPAQLTHIPVAKPGLKSKIPVLIHTTDLSSQSFMQLQTTIDKSGFEAKENPNELFVEKKTKKNEKAAIGNYIAPAAEKACDFPPAPVHVFTSPEVATNAEMDALRAENQLLKKENQRLRDLLGNGLEELPSRSPLECEVERFYANANALASSSPITSRIFALDIAKNILSFLPKPLTCGYATMPKLDAAIIPLVLGYSATDKNVKDRCVLILYTVIEVLEDFESQPSFASKMAKVITVENIHRFVAGFIADNHSTQHDEKPSSADVELLEREWVTGLDNAYDQLAMNSLDDLQGPDCTEQPQSIISSSPLIEFAVEAVEEVTDREPVVPLELDAGEVIVFYNECSELATLFPPLSPEYAGAIVSTIMEHFVVNASALLAHGFNSNIILEFRTLDERIEVSMNPTIQDRILDVVFTVQDVMVMTLASGVSFTWNEMKDEVIRVVEDAISSS
ncbi:hypothetical protein BDR26DRAFT_863079 [Obelidium mucronatum]|nr:hypothetical protein BDR26DRAFT_863079 [Obelidium mucronatum]